MQVHSDNIYTISGQLKMKQFYKKILLLLCILFFSIQVTPQSVSTIANQVNIDTLMQFVKELSGAVPTTINGQPYTIQSRHKLQPGNDMSMTWIQQKLQSYGYATTIQTFSTTGKNVYAVKPGTDFPNKKYMICAHFDAMPSGTFAPGADDNASGTAAVLEAARIMKDISFPYTIVFALWDEEEQGLVGSNYYASQAATAGDSILGVINLDMIAFDSNNDGAADIHTRAVGSSLSLWSKMVELNTQLAIGLNLTTRNPGSTYSDHAAFWTRGYGAILLIESDGDFHTQYHTVNDVISYFNIPYFHKMSKLSIATLASFALDQNIFINHTPIQTMDYSADITVPAIINTGMTLGTGNKAPSLYYRTDNGSGFTPFTRVIGNTKGSFSYTFTIPAQPMGTLIQYYLAVQDEAGSLLVTLPGGGSGFNPPGSVPPANKYQFLVASSTIALTDNASSLNNWTSVQGWGLATNKFYSAPTSFTDSPTGNYAASTTSSLSYNGTIDLTGTLGAALEFWTQWDIETGWDYGQVQVSTNNGTTWISLAGQYTSLGSGSFQPTGQPLYQGLQTTWVKETIDISSFKGNQLKLRFFFRSDNAIHKDGWYIDDITIHKYNVVPVELTSFSASIIDNKVVLSWTTATETNNKGYEVQRSSDNISWYSIGYKIGGGTTTIKSYYSYEDTPPSYGTYYYRLVQYDFDGTATTYDPINVDLSNFTFNLEQNYPNPFNPTTKIRYQLPMQSSPEQLYNVRLVVYDILGKEVVTLVNELQQAGEHEVEFNGAGLSSGMYIYKITAGDYKSVKKLLLQK
jgi:hypothetical protein